MEILYPYIVLPPLPEKKVLYAWQKITTDTFDPDFVDRRRAGLEVSFEAIVLTRNQVYKSHSKNHTMKFNTVKK